MPGLVDIRQRHARRTALSSGWLPACVRRRIAFALLVVFATGQVTALAHMGMVSHDHDTPCAACRVAGDHATGLLPVTPADGLVVLVETVAPQVPAHARPQVAPRSHPPRAPPIA